MDDVSKNDHGSTRKLHFNAHFPVGNSEVTNRDFEVHPVNMTREKERNPTSPNISKSDYNQGDRSPTSRGSKNLRENVEVFSDSFVNKQIVGAQGVDGEVPFVGESTLAISFLRVLDLLPISPFYLTETSPPSISGGINCPSFEKRSGFFFISFPRLESLDLLESLSY